MKLEPFSHSEHPVSLLLYCKYQQSYLEHQRKISVLQYLIKVLPLNRVQPSLWLYLYFKSQYKNVTHISVTPADQNFEQSLGIQHCSIFQQCATFCVQLKGYSNAIFKPCGLFPSFLQMWKVHCFPVDPLFLCK